MWFLPSAIDGYSRPAYTEALPDEKAGTAIAFLDRARSWLAAHGITCIERITTDNGACYRLRAFAETIGESRHQRMFCGTGFGGLEGVFVTRSSRDVRWPEADHISFQPASVPTGMVAERARRSSKACRRCASKLCAGSSIQAWTAC